MLQPRAGQAFAQSALLDEILFQSPNLPIEQVVCLVDKAESHIGYNFSRVGQRSS